MTKLAKKLNQATTAATSRRGFLQRVARLAGTTVAAMAGLLATRSANAAPGNGKGPKARLCCEYVVDWGLYERRCTQRKSCPEEWGGGRLVAQWEIGTCEDCF
jgi:hypothetical protein